ncbi:putative Lantibiotic dehydratase [Tenacibaculum litopenaei]|uniref:lantibiotic dehydratase family protein n=1 Tax=Tenacibaculum litopenaei TaxID=396016 RepID=UPI00389329C0
MKKPFQRYDFLEDFCFRTPLYPFNFLNKNLQEHTFTIADLEKVWADPIFKEAMYLASVPFYNEIVTILQSRDALKFEKIKSSFLKYLIRATTRCTPFGLFAGIGTGTIGTQNSVELPPPHQHQKSTNLDSHFLFELCKQLAQQKTVRNQLTFYPNTSLYRLGDYYRYVETNSNHQKKQYSIEAIGHNEDIESILSHAADGKQKFELVNFLTERGFETSESDAFLNLLIDHQILRSNLEINITGDDPLANIIQILDSLTGVSSITTALKSIQNRLASVAKTMGTDIAAYNAIRESLSALQLNFQPKYLFQNNLTLSAPSASISRSQLQEVKKALGLLLKLETWQPNQDLQRFKKAFYERYETRRVPLALALDIESGIGYLQNDAVSGTTPFLNDLTAASKGHKTFTNQHLSPQDRVLENKLKEALEQNAYEITLTDKDFSHFECREEYLPDTLTAFASLTTVNATETLFLQGFNTGAGKLIARFSESNDAINAQLAAIYQSEQELAQDKIIAEIVHLPESRTGNILRRKNLRSYEIPYLAKPSVPYDGQLAIGDLWLSLKNDELVLWSEKHQKEVIPKLTNAHNYSYKALPIYHFLSDLELQNKLPYIGFQWPSSCDTFDFLPRVSYRNTILAKAQWKISSKELTTLASFKNSTEFSAEFAAWRKKLKLVQHVALKHPAHALYLDLEHPDCIAILIESGKKNNPIVLEEFLFHEGSPVKNEKEHFTNEFLFTLKKSDIDD